MSKRNASPIFLLFAISILAGECAFADESSTQTAFEGMLIRHVIIERMNVFDPTIPGEDRWLYRTANGVHVTTRESVIEQQLLFAPGDRYSQNIMDESARLLRSNSYLKDASIEATAAAPGQVDVRVRTNDVWTLMPSVSVSRSGGSNSGGFAIKEKNLLGTGTYVGARFKSSVDRNTLSLEAADRNLFGSRVGAAVQYGVSTDGFSRALSLSQPFYSLDTRWAAGLDYAAGQQIDSLYDLGQISDQFDHWYSGFTVSAGLSPGLRDGWARRWSAGLTLDEHRFEAIDEPVSTVIPENRRFFYPWIAYEAVEDDYATETNVQQINQTEDRHFGTRYRVQAGRSTDAWHLDGGFSNGIRLTNSSSMSLGAGLTARLHDEGGRNVLGNVSADLFYRQSDHWQSYAGVRGVMGHRLDADNPVVLGGDTGLRGYPLRYQSGESSMLLTLEQRFFSDWYPFRLFHVGAAAFFDAGRTWGGNAAGSQSLGWLRNAGVGLRLGNNRSSAGKIFHVDLAFPLDGGSDISTVQFLFQAKSGF